MTIAVTAERASGFVAPEAAGRRAPLFHELDRSAGAVDDGLDLAPVAHDPWVLEEPFHVGVGEFRDRVEAEADERRSDVVPLGQDGAR